MKDAHETPALIASGRTKKRPIVRAAAIVYAALALVAVAVPDGLAGWVRDLKPGKVQDALLVVAETLEAASKAAHCDAPYKAIRSRFLEWTGKTDQ